MRVYYETVMEALDRIINRADESMRQIEKIVLTPAEWNELEREVEPLTLHPEEFQGVTLHTYRGVHIEKEQRR